MMPLIMPTVWVTVPDMITSPTFTACSATSATNVITSTCTTSASTCYVSATNALPNTAASTAGYGQIWNGEIWPLPTGAVIVIDEEDWMNHAEYYELARQRGVAFHIRTAAERARAAAVAEQHRLDRERRDRERGEALARSRALLLSHLTAEQRETFERNSWFVVCGGKTGARYRIKDTGITHNIEVLQSDGANERVAGRLCCHCRDIEIPKYDHYLAQKIGLAWDEERFLQTANRSAA